jgi:putative heme iron utilization protein
MTDTGESDAVRSARQLLSGRLRGTLATQSREHPGFPFGSLLPYSIGRDGWPLILISHLAKHTRNLEAVPQCCLTVCESGQGDIQTLMRLTCLAVAEPLPDIPKALAERHFRYFPEGFLYYSELNFHFYRLRPVRIYFVGGFGSARWIGRDRLEMRNSFSFQEEKAVLELINDRFGKDLRRCFQAQGHPQGKDGTGVSAVGLDPQGLDLRLADRLLRLPFPEPFDSGDNIMIWITKFLSETGNTRKKI